MISGVGKTVSAFFRDIQHARCHQTVHAYSGNECRGFPVRVCTARAIAWFGRHGIAVERIMRDNGSAYKSLASRDLLDQRGIQHKRTRPYTPRTNGKAERFIETSLREWAYAQPFQTSADRAAAMLPWLSDYNTSRPHSALGGKPPLTRLAALLTPPRATPVPHSLSSPRFADAAGVKPRAATAAGGLGLTPAASAQAHSASEGNNVLGSDI